MNFLSEIISRKQQQVEASKQAVDLSQVRDQARNLRRSAHSHVFRSQLSRSDQIKIIAEFKRRSPSKGVIRADADPVKIALDYIAAGAVAISVLTEEKYFDGSLEDLQAIRKTVDAPLLRKDFIFDEYQLYEAAIAGADAVLLIVAALEDAQLALLRKVIEEELSMDALVEVHTEEEIHRAVACGATLIGVNNRDLRTFEVSLETSLRLIDKAPADSILISESGLRTRNDLERLERAGYRGFLIGETLMRADSPKAALAELLERES